MNERRMVIKDVKKDERKREKQKGSSKFQETTETKTQRNTQGTNYRKDERSAIRLNYGVEYDVYVLNSSVYVFVLHLHTSTNSHVKPP